MDQNCAAVVCPLRHGCAICARNYFEGRHLLRSCVVYVTVSEPYHSLAQDIQKGESKLRKTGGRANYRWIHVMIEVCTHVC